MSKELIFDIVDSGKQVLVKQANGIKTAFVGFVLIRDIDGFIENRKLNNAIESISYKDLVENTTIIMRDVLYNFNNNLPYPVNVSGYNEKVNKLKNYTNYLFEIGRTEKGGLELNISPKDIQLVDVFSKQEYDAIALLSMTYKNETPNEKLFKYGQDVELFGLVYPEDGKFVIYKDSEDKLNYTINLNMELKTKTDNSTIDVSDFFPSDYSDKSPSVHIVNDNLEGLPTYGTTKTLFISNMYDVDTEPYDSYSKLNIMSKSEDFIEDSIPQLVLSSVNKNTAKWDGRAVEFNYNAGKYNRTFRIHEIKGEKEKRSNFDLFGMDNTLRNVSNSHGNSFIYSQRNVIRNNSNENFFMSSRDNILGIKGAGNNSFINSSNNIFRDDGLNVRNVSFYNSENNILRPLDVMYNHVGVKGIKGRNFVSKHLQNFSLLNTKDLTIKGRTRYDFLGTLVGVRNSTFEMGGTKNITMIGGEYNYISGNSGQFIGIGSGLIQKGGNSDKIVIGQWNEVENNENDIFIVACGESDINSIKSKAWRDSLESNEGTAEGGSWKRKNIFTVRKNGSVKFSPLDSNKDIIFSSESLNVYNSGNLQYNIKWKDVSNRIHQDDTMSILQSQVDSLNSVVEDMIDVTPTTKLIKIGGDEDLEMYRSGLKTNTVVNVYNYSNIGVSITAPELKYNTHSSKTFNLPSKTSIQFLFLKGVDVGDIESYGFYKID